MSYESLNWTSGSVRLTPNNLQKMDDCIVDISKHFGDIKPGSAKNVCQTFNSTTSGMGNYAGYLAMEIPIKLEDGVVQIGYRVDGTKSIIDIVDDHSADREKSIKVLYDAYLAYYNNQTSNGEKPENFTPLEISIDGGNNFPFCAAINHPNDIDWKNNTITLSKPIEDYNGNPPAPTKEDDTHLVYLNKFPSCGSQPLAEGEVAMGIDNHAVGKGATAFGRSNLASGGYSFVAGRDNRAGNYSTALGHNNKAYGMKSTATGANTVASGLHSFTANHKTTASGSASAAFGVDTVASGYASIAMGNGTKSLASGTLATGIVSEAKGNYSFAGGFGSKAGGEASFSYGYGVTGTTHKGQVTLGRYNNWRDDKIGGWLLAIGNGTSEDNLSTAFKVNTDGSAELQTMDENNDNSVVIKSYIDKVLDNLYAEGSGAIILDSSMSDSSVRPVQNKVVKAYVDEKTAPATADTYGTIKTPTYSEDAISYGFYRNDQGFLQIVPATESHINNRGWMTINCPITPNNLDYAVRSVGDGYYAKEGETNNKIEDINNKIGNINTALSKIINGG